MWCCKSLLDSSFSLFLLSVRVHHTHVSCSTARTSFDSSLDTRPFLHSAQFGRCSELDTSEDLDPGAGSQLMMSLTSSYSDDGISTDSSSPGRRQRPELGHSSSTATNSTGATSPWTPFDPLTLSQMPANAGPGTALKPLPESENGHGMRSFPTLILGLLTALEADPAHVARSLHSSHARAPANFGLSHGQTPAETDTILASISRIADKLAKQDDDHVRDVQTASHVGAFNHEAVSRLIGIQAPYLPKLTPITATLTTPSYPSHRASSPDNSPRSAVTDIAEDDIGLPSAEKELRQLKAQIKDFARVCKAVARGDLSQKVEVKVQGADLIELKEDINGMVEKLTTFANEGSFRLPFLKC